MFDFQGNAVESAGPSEPVSVLGLSDVPMAGELFTVVEDEREARAIAEERELEMEATAQERPVTPLEQLFEAFQAGETQELRLVVKADVQGSLEPVVTSVESLSTEEIEVRVLHSGTGNIGENDVMLAAASDATVIGFNVTADQAAQRVADSEGVDIRLYNIIYRLTEDIEKALKGMFEPEKRKVLIGRAEVRAIFRIPGVGNVAGCRVMSGELRRNAFVRVRRGDSIPHDGPVSSLKREQDDVTEVREGFECGIGLRNFGDFEEGDILECYLEETVAV
jgi:translation initiation factor IF-2